MATAGGSMSKMLFVFIVSAAIIVASAANNKIASSYDVAAASVLAAKMDSMFHNRTLTDAEIIKLEQLVGASKSLSDEEKLNAYKALSKKHVMTKRAAEARKPLTPIQAGNTNQDQFQNCSYSDTGPVGSNDHWCCKIAPQPTLHGFDVVRAQLLTVATPSYGTRSCGFLGLSRCQTVSTAYSQKVVYYMDKDVYEIPTYHELCTKEYENAEKLLPNLVCCSCYVYVKSVDNCLTVGEVKALIQIVNENKETLDILGDYFG